MKKIFAFALAVMLLFVSCGTKSEKKTEDITTQVTTFKVPDTEIATEETTAEEVSSVVTAETAKEVSVTETTEETTVSEEKDSPKEFNIDNAVSVEDYFGGDVLYMADFDGDGEKEGCTVKILGHGTQCYVEDIEIVKANGEKLAFEHPITATGINMSFYKFEDHYSICFRDLEYTEIKYPFESLRTFEKDLIAPRFGDIFDYSVIGDKLYFRGSLACGFAEVLGDIFYEYTYHDGALKVSHIWYKDYINNKEFDIGDIYPASFIVDPSIEDKNVKTLPEGDHLIMSNAIMGNPAFLVYEKGLTYYVKQYTSALSDEFTVKKYTLSLPVGYADGVIVESAPGGGSGELGFWVHAKRGDTDVVLYYLFFADRLAAPVYVCENEDTVFTPDKGSKLYDLSWEYCLVREYVSTDDERVLYYIIDVGDGQRIRYDKIDGAHPAGAKDLVTFADVNFDGYEDLCVKLGNFGAQGAVIVRAYLGDENGKYTLCESFEEIPNPVIDAENKQILGTNRESAGEYSYRKFEFKDGEFVKVASLVHRVADETVEINGEVLPSDEFERQGSEWDISNTKWYRILTETDMQN